MQRYFIHLKNSTYTPKDATILLTKARELVEKDIVIRDCRVSKKYIELDTSMSESTDISILVRALEKISPLANYEHIVERHVEKEESIKRAIELFNDEKYWGTHEALEGVWKETPPGSERDLLNGMILVAAAFVHDEKDEREICMSILKRARMKLEGATGMYHGIDMDRFVTLIQNILTTGIIERFTI